MTMTAKGPSASTLAAIASMTTSAVGVTTILFPVVSTFSASLISVVVAAALLFLSPVPPYPPGWLPSSPPGAIVPAAGTGVVVVVIFVRSHPVKSCHALPPLFFSANPGWGEEEGSENPVSVGGGGGGAARRGDLLFWGTTFCSE